MVRKLILKSIIVLLAYLIGVGINIFFGGVASYFVDIIREKDGADIEFINDGMSSIPPGALILTLFGAVLGSFIAGLVVVAFSKSEKYYLSCIIGIGLFLFPGIYIMIVTSAPGWFNVINLLSYLIFAYFGGTYYLLTRARK